MKGKTDWNKIKSMKESEVLSRAKTDLDAKPLSIKQLKNFKRAHSPEKIDVKAIRTKLHISQKQFAYYFGVSIRTIQEWEQHRRNPTSTARNFLKVIEREPKAVQKALSYH